jgi:predicted permease
MRALRRLTARLTRRDLLDGELSEEMQFHLERQTQENIRRGMEPEAARRAARAAFGSVAAAEEQAREAGGWPTLESVVSDVRHTLRLVRLSPSFAFSVIATLAVAIAACATMFSVVDAVLLRPIGMPQPERLLAVYEATPTEGILRGAFSPANFLDVREQSHSFSALSAYYFTRANLAGRETESIRALDATADLFRALGVAPEAGRGFVADDETAGGVTVLAHALAVRQFGSAAAAVGKSVILDGKQVQVIGVMPADFHFPNDEVVMWRPLSFGPSGRTARGGHYLRVIGRLAAGVMASGASRELELIGARLAAAYPDTNGHGTVRVERHDESLVSDVRRSLLTLMAAVVVLGLIACANVANLLIVRVAGRSRELAMRSMLGATRARVVRQLITESTVLALIAGGVAVFLTAGAVRLITAFGPDRIPRLAEAQVDGRVLAVSFGAALLGTIFFALLPALSASRVQGLGAIQGSRIAGGRAAARMRTTMAAVQLTLAVTLLAGAALLIRSFLQVTAIDLGFDPHDVVTFRVSLPATYDSAARVDVFWDEALRRLRALPGVTAAGVVSHLPVSGGHFGSSFRVNGVENPNWSAAVYTADRGFFDTFHIPLQRGRLFDDHDRLGTPRVMLISESAAKAFWPAGNALGQQLRVGASDGYERNEGVIVGIVRDIRHEGQEHDVDPTFYVPLQQAGIDGATFTIKSSTALPQLLPSIKAAIAATDRNVAVATATTMEADLAASVSRRRFQATLLAFFAAAALLLASLGIYGVVAYSVGQRTREIGVRVAVGASLTGIFRMIVGEAVRIVVPAVVGGLIVAIAGHRVIASLLFGVSGTDVAALTSVAAVVTIVSLLAAAIPARRATRVDPITALRTE